MTKVAKLSGPALTLLLGCNPSSPAERSEAGSEAWVTVDHLNQRTCPNERCGTVGQLPFRQKVTVYEERSGWSRISRYYDAACKDEKSEYVDTGNASCKPSNGIEAGRLAEWVSSNHLSTSQPADPAAGATGDYTLIRGSDDYRIYKDVFAKAAVRLIESGQCTRADFEEMGGWTQSTNHRGRPIYFMYCGGLRRENRIYLDASTGEVSKSI
jgi:hypothetical protein